LEDNPLDSFEQAAPIIDCFDEKFRSGGRHVRAPPIRIRNSAGTSW